jgi:hypothetical protein
MQTEPAEAAKSAKSLSSAAAAVERRLAVERAVYLDFEGLKDQPPVLAGVLCEAKFRQVVFDERFQTAAQAWRLTCQPFAQTMIELQRRCQDEGRLLVCFSEFELRQVEQHCDVNLAAHYVNALACARRWKNRFHPAQPMEDYRLKSFFRLIKYRVPECIGEGNAAERLRYVRDQLAAHAGLFKRVSAGAKERWRLLLAYNDHDCRGMRVLMRKVVRARWDPGFALRANVYSASKQPSAAQLSHPDPL